MKDYLKRNYNWLLLLSISFYLLGLVLSLLIDLDMKIDDNPIAKLIADSSGWLILVFTVILAPLIEEFSFRSWAIRKRWTKYLSLILSSLFLIAISPIFAGVYFAAFLTLLILYRNKENLLLIILSFISSIGFVLAHVNNLEITVFLLSLPMYFGVALFLSYIAIRFKFRYAILAHALYNFTLLFAGGLIIPFGSTIELNEGNYKGTLKPVSGLIIKTDHNQYGGYSAKIHRKLITEIVKDLNFDSPYEYSSLLTDYRFYTLDVENDKSSLIDLKALSDEIVSKANLKLDTVERVGEVYKVIVEDIESIRYDESIDENPNNFLTYITIFARSYSKDIEIAQGLDTLMIKPGIIDLDISDTKTFEEAVEDLRVHGIIIEKTQGIIREIKVSK